MTYEYRCRSCGHEWEVEQKITEPPVRECPACKQPQAERQASGGVGFTLKGTGWYKDGYS